jgi:moderate conductance mechanosensitive channel
MWRSLFGNTAVDWRLVALAVAPTAIIAWLGARVARRAATVGMRHVLRDTVVTTSPLVRAPLRLIGLATFGLLLAVLIFPAFELAGLHPRAGVHLRTLSTWAFDSGLRVVLIMAVAVAVIRTVALSVKRFEHDVNFGTGLDALERAKRARTLGGILTSVTTFVVLAVASLMILHEFKVDISPALTGAGIVGVAFGFGAQSLVKDLIGGFFLILENQVRVGDVVAINGTGGLVEEINLRTTVLRDEEGTVHIFPNGNITTLANRSMQFSFYVVNLPLAYGENVDAVVDLMRQIAADLQHEDAFQPFILAPLEVIGVDAFERDAVRVKVRIKTAPLKQWFVGREFRRRLLAALGERGIQMWSPQLTATVSTPKQPIPNSHSASNPTQASGEASNVVEGDGDPA